MKYLKYLIAILAPFAAGLIGNLATTPNIPTWYAGLDKPPLNPPNEVFGPVWSILYLLIGISICFIIATHAKHKTTAYISYAVQLALNTLWSFAFFGLHNPWLGIVVIFMLIAAIIWNMASVRPISRVAALLLVPYLAWVCFATYLTIGIAALN